MESSPKGISPVLIWAVILVGALSAAVTFCWMREDRVSGPGIQLVYRIRWTYRDRESLSSKKALLAYAVRRRIEAAGGPRAHVQVKGDNLIVWFSGIDPARGLDKIRLLRLLATGGHLEVFAVASFDIQEKFNLDGEMPAGFRLVDNPRLKMSSAAYERNILIKERPIIDGRNIVASGARQVLEVGAAQWVTTFDLDIDGAKYFDEAAQELFHQKGGPGMIAIILDGKLRTLPVVRSASFAGRVQISGSSNEEEARQLAIALGVGSFPAELEGIKMSIFLPGQGVEEYFFGPKIFY